jgi:hypothetical protein
MRAREEVGEEALGEFGDQVGRGQPQVARLEVELGGDKELDGGKLEGEGVGQGGPNHRMGVRGCLPGWKDSGYEE